MCIHLVVRVNLSYTKNESAGITGWIKTALPAVACRRRWLYKNYVGSNAARTAAWSFSWSWVPADNVNYFVGKCKDHCTTLTPTITTTTIITTNNNNNNNNNKLSRCIPRRKILNHASSNCGQNLINHAKSVCVYLYERYTSTSRTPRLSKGCHKTTLTGGHMYKERRFSTVLAWLREHLISSQFFSKRNAFQIGFTSLPSPSIRKAYRTFSDNNRCRPSSIPRLSTTKLLRRVSRPSPQEKLQPTSSSPLLPRFLHSPSLSTHRLFCAWPPPEADRDCRQRAGGAMPDPAHVPGRFAKAGQPRPRSISAASWSTGVWAVTEPDACTRSELRNQFSFFVENVRFVIFHPKLALPPSPRFEMRCV